PATGVHNDERAVGVFEDVSGMKVSIVADEEIRIGRFVGRTAWFHDAADDLVHVEAGDEEVVLKSLAEYVGLVTRETARRGGAEVGHHRQQVAGAWVI